MKYTLFFLLVDSLISSGVFFLKGLALSLSKDILWLKFMALGLFSSAVSNTLALYCGGAEMLASQKRSSVIAAYTLICLAALFFWAYRLTKK